jgi:RNA polymerase sigma-70 factor (ECF subfamily)
LDDEYSIIERAKSDPEQFGVLLERHYPAIFAYIHRRVNHWEAAKDLASEVFLKAFKGLWRYRWQGVPFSAWLYRIATNEVRMHFRRGARPLASLDQMSAECGFEPIDPATLEAEKLAAERKVQDYEDFLVVREKVLLLSLKYQDVITLRYFERKSVKEIAEILQKREGTIKSLLSRGIAKLRNLL